MDKRRLLWENNKLPCSLIWTGKFPGFFLG